MRKPFEARQAVDDGGLRGLQALGGRQRRERVLEVVRARQGEARRGDDGVARLRDVGHERPALEPCRVAGAAGPAAPGERDPTRGRDDRTRRRVVVVDDGEVVRGLPGEDPRLGGEVGVEVPVAIEMVRRHVRQHRDVGAEPIHRFELERRDLAHEIARAFLGEKARQGRADVPGEHDPPAGALQDLGDPGRRRGLAVGARDRDPAMPSRRLRLGDPPGDLELRENGDAAAAGPRRRPAHPAERPARRRASRLRRETPAPGRRRRAARPDPAAPRGRRTRSRTAVRRPRRRLRAPAAHRRARVRCGRTRARRRAAAALGIGVIAASASRARRPRRAARRSRSG